MKMPPFPVYHVYCDETYIRGDISFALGGLVCTARRAEILENQLNEVRSDHAYSGELKWNKIRRHNLPIYAVS
jgi:hypothetical protein